MAQISVIVPVYNVESYLRRCVDSILSQTFSDFELILVDDGSPDRCADICDAYAAMDPRVSVIHQQNCGLAGARNAGIEKAVGEWVCFIDSDDCVHPEMLQMMFQAAKEPNVNMVVCDCVQSAALPENFYQSQPLHFEIKEINQEYLLSMFQMKVRAYWTVVPVLIKTEIPKKYPFTVGRIFEDNAVSVSWLCEAKTVAFLDAKLYFYMTNPEGIVQEAFSPKKLDFLWALEQQLSFLETCGYTALQGEVAKRYIEDAIWFAGRVKMELNDPQLARSVIGKAVKIRKKYAACCQLTPTEERKLFKTRHPLLHKVKKRLKLY